ncbi:MAG: hypothetical protein OEM52_11870 [bacterium]|nr:hypothetical protein [bacterium]
MGNSKKLTVKLNKDIAVTVTRVAIGSDRLVYLILANKPYHYSYGDSRIVYIGTTENGLSRIADSVAERANEILNNHGINSITVRVVTCKPRQKVKTWFKLESALRLAFRQIYGVVPYYNDKGKVQKETDEFQYFALERMKNIIKKFEGS